jgi:CubicO group peptidase (beta-lactamase class C family)
MPLSLEKGEMINQYMHESFMKPTYSFRILIFLISWLPALNSCIPGGDYKIPVNFEPKQTGDGWDISDAGSEGFNTELLQNVYEIMFSADQFITSRSLLIVKNGRLVSESYFRSQDDIHRKNNIKGITKCFASVLAGFAYDRQILCEEDTLYSFIPGYFDGNRDKRDITIGHILTMRTGLEWDDNINTISLFNNKRFPNSIRTVISKPLTHEAGSNFSCNYGTPQLLMGVLRESLEMDETGPLLLELFDPLGIDDFVWEKHGDGLHYGGTGLHLKPRDLARFGQFCLQKGAWKGTHLISESWMNRSTAPILGTEITGSDMQYGHYWWVDPRNNAFFGKGEGGQFLYIVPDRDIVIVHTANPSVGSGYKGIILEDFMSIVDMIIDAVL